MDSLHSLIARGDTKSTDTSLTPLMVNLLISLLVILFIGLIALAALLYLRARRAPKADTLPMYNESRPQSSNHRRLTITATPYGRHSQPIHVYSEKQNLVANSNSPPPSPDNVPEIRVTFPEERDESGRRKSGRVVVVHVGETGVGLEPYQEDDLPPYQRSEAERFHSLDLERIGGLKEKDNYR